MYWFRVVLKKYFIFKGRSGRIEFWMFMLWSTVLTYLVRCGYGFGILINPHYDPVIVDLSTSILDSLVSIFFFIPTISVGFRRMHDIGRSGWWFFCPIINLVFLVRNSQQGDNQYGPNPKAAITGLTMRSSGRAYSPPLSIDVSLSNGVNQSSMMS